MNIFEIKLADGDSINYETEMSLDELKKYISSNDFIELPRAKTVPYGSGGWRRVPELASYQTKSIVYINHDIELEKIKKYNQEILNKQSLKVDEILKYKFNKKMIRYLKWNISDLNWRLHDDTLKETLCHYSDKNLDTILIKCKKYKCKMED